jgi:NAD(P)-dependent dehydrogenase (short-subunit alcohol dehydrogenase family)
LTSRSSSTPEGAWSVVETAIARTGGVDILINNVGAGDGDVGADIVIDGGAIKTG